MSFSFFFFNDTATTEIYTLSLHDALPISYEPRGAQLGGELHVGAVGAVGQGKGDNNCGLRIGDSGLGGAVFQIRDRKSTRLNSSHSQISYAVFCLKKKKQHDITSAVRTDR